MTPLSEPKKILSENIASMLPVVISNDGVWKSVQPEIKSLDNVKGILLQKTLSYRKDPESYRDTSGQ